jgi:hypothetical protein
MLYSSLGLGSKIQTVSNVKRIGIRLSTDNVLVVRLKIWYDMDAQELHDIEYVHTSPRKGMLI